MSKKFKVTIKRTQIFYNEIIVEAKNAHEARDIADHLSYEGEIVWDYDKIDSMIIDEIILPVSDNDIINEG